MKSVIEILENLKSLIVLVALSVETKALFLSVEAYKFP